MNLLACESIFRGLPPSSSGEDVWALDLELSGLRESQLHRPEGRMTSLAGTCDGKNVYIVFEEKEVAEFLQRIEKATLVFHNSTFDIAHLRRWANLTERKNMRDTLLIERLMFSNYYTDFGLNHLVRRYLNCHMTKDVRKEFHNLEGAMTEEQIQYAALDVIGTWLVDKEQQKIITSTDKMLWDRLYNPHVWTTLELGGFKLDVDMWRDLYEKNLSVVEEISEKLGTQYGQTKKKLVGRGKARHEEDYFEPFNPNSHPQVKNILLTQYQLELESTDDDHIRPFYETNEFVKDILDYRKAEKQVSTYGLSFLKNVESDDRIYTSLNIGLAESGRDSSSSPNLQNIPKDKERRKCFIAGRGKKLSLYDYSGQEAGTWAFITGDEKFKEIINSGKKLYIEVARIAFDEVIVKGTTRYDIIKSLVLLLMYGGTAYGFARNNREELMRFVDQSLSGKELDTAILGLATDMYNKFMKGFPTSAKWIEEQQKYNRGVAKTILGRRGHLHPYSREWKNNALNTPNQGSGADMIKLAMKNLRKTSFYKKYYPEGRVCILLQVHDEILTEVDLELSEEWTEIHKRVMIETAETLTPGVRANVEGGLIDNWSEKK